MKELSDVERGILEIAEDIANFKEDYYQLHPLGSLYTSHFIEAKNTFDSVDNIHTSEGLLNYLSTHEISIKEIMSIWKSFRAKSQSEPSKSYR